MAKKSEEVSKFISAREIANRWGCSRASVDRITRRLGINRFYLGHGRNGMVRFLRKDITDFEEARCTKIKPI